MNCQLCGKPSAPNRGGLCPPHVKLIDANDFDTKVALAIARRDYDFADALIANDGHPIGSRIDEQRTHERRLREIVRKLEKKPALTAAMKHAKTALSFAENYGD